MGIQQRTIPSHWNYFLCIEEDVSHLSRWIEFHSDNKDCYSVELARLLMAASAEADVVAKMLCQKIDEQAKASSINKYREVLIERFPKLPQATVEIPKHGLVLTPWDEWKEPDSPPHWWTGNNKVKHHRSKHFKEANLKNALNAVAGVYLLLLLNYAQEEPSISPASKLFQPKSFAYRDGDFIVFLAQEQHES